MIDSEYPEAPTEPDPYPEHQKLHAVVDQTQAIGEFMEWLGTQQYIVCEWQARTGEDPAGYYPVQRPINSWLAQYFGIDPAKIEAEKRHMLDTIRAANGAADLKAER